MLTVPQAARRVGREPETIRRWIRTGRLRALKVGTQYVVEKRDLDAAVTSSAMAPLPEAWRFSPSGEPAPNWVEAIHEGHRGR